MTEKNFLFTSESVSEGHPDKVADQVSDAILDAILTQDPNARVGAETLVNTGLCVLAGEITTTANVDYISVARKKIVEIGYDSSEVCYDGNTLAVMVCYDRQSPDIAAGVDEGSGIDLGQGAWDQWLMFWFACDETPDLMPAPIFYAHRLMERQAEVRKNGVLPWLRPDAKSQVTFRYVDGKPVDVETVVISTQHREDVSHKEIEEAVIETIIKPVIPENLRKNPKYFINPTGRFVIWGPMGDCGLTGRKIIVDSYGGSAPHGGGAFSGKDPSKVDRSAAYAGRYVAKNVVASGLAKRCLIQVAYAIWVAEPVSVSVDTFGTGILSDGEIEKIIRANFDLRPKGIVAMLDLLKPRYAKTAAYGHFGRNDPLFTWENTDLAKTLRTS